MAFYSRIACIVVFLQLTPYLCSAGVHPTRVDEHTNCLECHADRATGTYVHPALKQGCTACHTIENREDATYVVVKSAKAVVCSSCHASENYARAHFPYASSMCLRCHDPHTSSYPPLLRTRVNDLCLQCHLRTPNARPSEYLATITLTDNNTMGHPYERHPVAVATDPVTGKEISCASCHLAHGSSKVHHLKTAAEIPEDALNQSTEVKDMCHKCHLRLWGLEGVGKKKKHRW